MAAIGINSRGEREFFRFDLDPVTAEGVTKEDISLLMDNKSDLSANDAANFSTGVGSEGVIEVPDTVSGFMRFANLDKIKLRARITFGAVTGATDYCSASNPHGTQMMILRDSGIIPSMLNTASIEDAGGAVVTSESNIALREVLTRTLFTEKDSNDSNSIMYGADFVGRRDDVTPNIEGVNLSSSAGTLQTPAVPVDISGQDAPVGNDVTWSTDGAGAVSITSEQLNLTNRPISELLVNVNWHSIPANVVQLQPGRSKSNWEVYKDIIIPEAGCTRVTECSLRDVFEMYSREGWPSDFTPLCPGWKFKFTRAHDNKIVRAQGAGLGGCAVTVRSVNLVGNSVNVDVAKYNRAQGEEILNLETSVFGGTPLRWYIRAKKVASVIDQEQEIEFSLDMTPDIGLYFIIPDGQTREGMFVNDRTISMSTKSAGGTTHSTYYPLSGGGVGGAYGVSVSTDAAAAQIYNDVRAAADATEATLFTPALFENSKVMRMIGTGKVATFADVVGAPHINKMGSSTNYRIVRQLSADESNPTLAATHYVAIPRCERIEFGWKGAATSGMMVEGC